ncbi:MAG: glycosyl hydrolase family 18 protein [bacterium]
MTKQTKITTMISTILILVILNSTLVYLFFFSKDFSFLSSKMSESKYELNYNLISSDNEVYKKEYNFKKVIGWIAAFDYQNGKNSYYNNINKFTEISPVYYDLNSDGTVSSRPVAGDSDLLNISKRNKVKVIPTIISFDENGLQAMFADDAKFKVHQDFLLSQVDKYDYDGIDIDYESVNLTDKEPYFTMIQDLADKLHNRNKILSITVIAKDSDLPAKVLPETKQVQDWNRIGKYADEIRVMAYDYSAVDKPGPVSPIFWVENILKYSLDKTTSDKIILGQPLYAYAYGSSRYAYTYDEIDEIIKAQKLIPEFNKDSNEKILKFTKGSEERTMWYQDVETMLRRFYIIDKYNAGGIAFWRLGSEDERIYGMLKSQR